MGHAPKSINAAQAAALPLTAVTAWELLFDRLNFQAIEPTHATSVTKSLSNVLDDGQPPQTILIIGAAGGVGSILSQLAVNLTQAKVIATASRPESQQWLKTMGVHHVIDHHKNIQRQLSELGIESVTHVISLTHTEQHFDALVEVLAPQGKLALIDDPKGGLDIMKLKMKSISLHWEFMFTRSMYQTHDMKKQHQLLNHLANLIDKNILKPTVGEHFGKINAKNLIRAHAHIESHQAIGKIVLENF